MRVPSVSNWDEWECWWIPLSRYYWLLLFPLCSCMFHSLSSVSEKLLTRTSCSSFHMLLWKIIILIYWLRGIWEWNESHIQEVKTPLMKVKSGKSPWAAFDITCFTSCPSGHWKWTVYGLFLETLEVLCKNKKLASCV